MASFDIYPDLTQLVILIDIGGFINTNIKYAILDDNIDEEYAQNIKDIRTRVERIHAYAKTVSHILSTTVILESRIHDINMMKQFGSQLGFQNIVSLQNKGEAILSLSNKQYTLKLEQYKMHQSFLLAYTLVQHCKNVCQVVIQSNSSESGKEAIDMLSGITWNIPNKKPFPLQSFTYLRLYFDPHKVEHISESPHTIVLDTLTNEIVEPLVKKADTVLVKTVSAIASTITSWFT
ncbi:MAG: hypothetical protein Homavirus29_3 [Homavirus sp.]|uniref:Uncharacterized protein n=1 Tax=Homavirus sp. TaxID=2487769 RepID=A0A3G5A4Z2_9VIRU|nr:MAG: hypothetical protein Homavirus29_3 [Homavirus sp.]